jgi:hypothetical protein
MVSGDAMRHAPLFAAALASLASISCDGSMPITPPAPLVHEFPAVSLDVGEEVLSLCQSWTLDNDEPLFVNAVHMSAGPGWHHSNWTFVPEDTFVGDDGTWRCSEREFSEVAASLRGGGVFFAQSTQATEEHQEFPEGTIYVIPARSRIIGSVHVLNTTGAPLSSSIRFQVDLLARGQVSTVLQPLAIDNRGIDLQPRTTTEVMTECDFDRATSGPLEAEVFYLLPHYHGLADGMRIEVFGGDRDGEVVFETTGGIGNALGGPVDPPLSLAGAQGLRVRCTYTNTSNEAVGWGTNSADEMCTMLAYVTGPNQLGGTAGTIEETVTLENGTIQQRSSCFAVGARGRQP